MSMFPVYPLFDLTPVRGEACYVYDAKGQAYLDFYGGHAVISIGHSHPHYVASITDQVQKLGFYSNSIHNPLQLELARKLGALSGCEDYQLFLCNSGAEANENALKMASFYNQRTKVLAFKGAFHGRTSAAVNTTDKSKIKAPINKGFPVEFLNWNDIEAVAQTLAAGDVCAVIIEGIQGIHGIHVPDPDFLEQLADLCKQQDTVLILDEIQSGYGRSGHFFAYQYANIEPDLITMAKGMGNGFPIGGLLIHPRFQASYGMLGTTFGGNHLACAAGIAVLDIIKKENLMENARHWGAYLKSALAKLPQIKEVRGKGLMLGLDLGMPIAAIRKRLLFEKKVFTGSAADPNVLRLLPPLTVRKEEVDLLLERLKMVLNNE